MKWMFWIVPNLELVGRAHGQQTVQIQVQPQVVGRSIRDGQVTTVFLAPRYVTAIRMPEPINSVVAGDPASFTAEHSDREPNLVFVKPITAKEAQTNLLISSTRGLQASLLLISRGEPKEEGQPAVDFLMRYKPAGQFMIQPADPPSAMIPQTITVASTTAVSSASGLSVPVVPASLTARGVLKERPALLATAAANSTKLDRPALDDLLDRQRRAPLPVLHGQKPGISPPGKELVKTGVSEVIDQGSEVVVLFSVMNVQDHAVELMPPQIQLGGMKRSGKIVRKSRWSTAEQLPVTDFRISRRRLGPGERADGVVVFKRPSFKRGESRHLCTVLPPRPGARAGPSFFQCWRTGLHSFALRAERMKIVAARNEIRANNKRRPLIAFRLEEKRGQVGKVLPPQRPDVADVGDFDISELDVLSVQPVAELPVHAHQVVGGAAGDPEQEDLGVGLGVELREVPGHRLGLDGRRPTPSAAAQ